MKVINLYYPFWKKCISVLTIQMKNARNGMKTIPLSESEFKIYGNRPSAGFGFNLQTRNGIINNDISGSAVARDLFDVLKQDANTAELLKTGHYKFSMGTDFQLKISFTKPIENR